MCVCVCVCVCVRACVRVRVHVVWCGVVWVWMWVWVGVHTTHGKCVVQCAFSVCALLCSVAFKVYDIDQDGYISNGELFQVLKTMVGNNLTDKQLQQIVDKTILYADKDGDGKISYEEFEPVRDAHKSAKRYSCYTVRCSSACGLASGSLPCSDSRNEFTQTYLYGMKSCGKVSALS